MNDRGTMALGVLLLTAGFVGCLGTDDAGEEALSPRAANTSSQSVETTNKTLEGTWTVGAGTPVLPTGGDAYGGLGKASETFTVPPNTTDGTIVLSWSGPAPSKAHLHLQSEHGDVYKESQDLAGTDGPIELELDSPQAGTWEVFTVPEGPMVTVDWVAQVTLHHTVS